MTSVETEARNLGRRWQDGPSLKQRGSGRLHRRQPTRLPRPWDSPGKNTGLGCHFFLQCMKVKSESDVTP